MDVILVPGFWLDASSWDDVVAVLVDAGHRPRAPTLPGGPRAGLRDHVDAVVAAVDASAAPPVLVAHSGAAAPVHAAVDARPDRVVRAVYVDSWPTADGLPVNGALPVVDGEVPLPDWSSFDDAELVDLDDDLCAAFRARAVPTPAGAARDRQRLRDDRWFDVPITVVACAAPASDLRSWADGGAPELAELRRIRDVAWVDLPTGHWPQLTRPRDLGAVVAAALG